MQVLISPFAFLFVVDANNEFVQAGGMEESTKLLKQASNKPHLVFNLISLFMAISQDGNIFTCSAT